eukprot:SM000047S16922  [mRNA]  locus=s47:695751:702301:- [translate_table: standard]
MGASASVLDADVVPATEHVFTVDRLIQREELTSLGFAPSSYHLPFGMALRAACSELQETGTLSTQVVENVKQAEIVLTITSTVFTRLLLHWAELALAGEKGILIEWAITHYVAASAQEVAGSTSCSLPIGHSIDKAQTPFTSTEEGGEVRQVVIRFSKQDAPDAVKFVLKDEETGRWLKNHRDDFVVPCSDLLSPGAKAGPMVKTYTLERQRSVQNNLRAFAAQSPTRVRIETDIEVPLLLHWGVVEGEGKNLPWLVPPRHMLPPGSTVHKTRAVQTPLQIESGKQSLEVQTGRRARGLRFVLKEAESGRWIDDRGGNFFVPLPYRDISQSVGQTDDEDITVSTLPSYSSGASSAEGTSEPSSTIPSKAESTVCNISDVGPTDVRQPPERHESTAAGIMDLADIATESEPEPEPEVHVQEPHAVSSDTNNGAEAAVLATAETEEKFLIRTGQVGVASRAEDGKVGEALARSAESQVSQDVAETTSGTLEAVRQEQVNARAAQSGLRQGVTEEVNSSFDTWEPGSSATGTGREILLQAFNWESHKCGRWYGKLKAKAEEVARSGMTMVWFPPPAESIAPQGYMPRDLYSLQSRYGNMEQLQQAIQSFQNLGVRVLADVVINHRCAHRQNQKGVWNRFGGKLDWNETAIVCDDPTYQGKGNKSRGDFFGAAPNIDHSQEFVRKDLALWLQTEAGYDGWRFDFVRGYWGGHVKEYIEASDPDFSVGEYWDSLSYTGGRLNRNQDKHRQRIVKWLTACGGLSSAFDVTLKGILHAGTSVDEACFEMTDSSHWQSQAVETGEYGRLADSQGRPAGLLGLWPSRTVTFIENHDTGSTQGHWRFPQGKEGQGYAYILTHPGTPSVFWDHLFSSLEDKIAALVGIRKRNQINCGSKVHIEKAQRNLYAAKIDDKVWIKLGRDEFVPPATGSGWSIAVQGPDYIVWEAARQD